jgi:caffeoyl-CoA O-methyltransferase
LEKKNAEVARESFSRAGMTENVRIHIGNAVEKLPGINRDGPFDVVFIDADKKNYSVYLAWSEEHLRIGGVVLADNAFAWGHISDASYTGEDAESVRALRQFSERLARGGRFRATMIPTEEGLAMGVKIR